MNFTKALTQFFLRSSRMRKLAAKWRCEEPDEKKQRTMFAVALAEDFLGRYRIKDRKDHHPEVVLVADLVSMIEKQVDWFKIARLLLSRHGGRLRRRRKKFRWRRPSSDQQSEE